MEKREEKELDIVFCKNCGDIVEKNFCPNCGQERKEINASFKEIFSEFIEDIFNFDSKLFKTLKILFLQPGRLSKLYLQGKRANYITPFRLYLMISILFFILIHFRNIILPEMNTIYQDIRTHGFVPDSTLAIERFNPTKNDSLNNEPNEKLNVQIGDHNFEDVLDKKTFLTEVLNGIQRSMFFLIPIAGFILQLLFIRQKRKFIDHFVFILHLQAVYFAGFILLMIDIIPYFGFIILLALYIYSILAFQRFYQVRMWKVIIKFQIFQLLYFAVLIIAALVSLVIPLLTMYYTA